MVIGGRSIGPDEPCYVIAEVGHNHQGDVEKCKALFAAAKECGADAVKLQKRDNRSLYTQAAFDKPYENENSFGATYGEHREALEFDRAEYLELKAYCEEIGIAFFATAFDLPSLDFLEDIDLPAYKIASGDIRNTPLIRAVVDAGKPVILSTGGATMATVVEAYDIVAASGVDMGILQCTAGYPAAWEELDLRVIPAYLESFPSAVIGLSSHDNGIAMATAAVALGARIVEKHFTLDRTWRGTDHKFSLEPVGLRKMVRDLQRLHLAMGSTEKRVHESEQAPILKMAKSLVASRDLPIGHVLTVEDIGMKSPGDGMAPSLLATVLGARLLAPLKADTQLAYGYLELPLAKSGPKINGHKQPVTAGARR